jgi:hypothetical protein
VQRNRGHTVCLLADRRFKYNDAIKGQGSVHVLDVPVPFPGDDVSLPGVQFHSPTAATPANFGIADTVNVRIYVCFVCSLDEIYPVHLTDQFNSPGHERSLGPGSRLPVVSSTILLFEYQSLYAQFSVRSEHLFKSVPIRLNQKLTNQS